MGRPLSDWTNVKKDEKAWIDRVLNPKSPDNGPKVWRVNYPIHVSSSAVTRKSEWVSSRELDKLRKRYGNSLHVVRRSKVGNQD